MNTLHTLKTEQTTVTFVFTNNRETGVGITSNSSVNLDRLIKQSVLLNGKSEIAEASDAWTPLEEWFGRGVRVQWEAPVEPYGIELEGWFWETEESKSRPAVVQ